MGKNAHYIELLRNEIKNTFKKEAVSVRSTIELADDIFNTTGKKISPSTLQRFFELITNASYPSKTTLNILAEYVHYSSWEDFIKKNKEPLNHTMNSKLIVDDFGISLLNICLKNHDFNSVLEYINMLPPSEHASETMHQKIAETLGVFLRQSKKGRDLLIPELAKSDNGRGYFFENFVDIDYLNIYFSEALNYYKKGSTVFNKREQKQAHIFANSIQYLNLLKTNNKREAIKNAHLISKIIPQKEVSISTLNHVYPVARYYYTQLTYLYVSKQLTIQKLESILNSVKGTIDNNTLNSKELIILLSQVCEALLFCKCYTEIRWLYLHYKKEIDTGYNGAFAYLPLISAIVKSYEQLQELNEFKTSFSLPEIIDWSQDCHAKSSKELEYLKTKLT